MKKKAQMFGTDLMIASIIFFIGIIAFFMYSLNSPNEAQENIDSLIYDGGIIADSILSDGYPQNWNQDNVIKIGILDNNKINQTKLENFYELTINNYDKTKSIFNTKFDYYLFLNNDMVIDSQTISGFGKPGINPDNIDTENLVKITRFTIYKNKPLTMYLYIWD